METYEEKYKKALEWMREVYPTLQGAAKEDAECYFPELADSESERIRKELISFFKDRKSRLDRMEDILDPSIFPCGDYSLCEKAIAWLEKKCEPVDINPSEFDLRLNKLLKQFESLPKEELVSSLSFYLNIIQNDGTYKEENQGEQKPAEKTTWYGNMDDLIADAMIDDVKNADMPEHCKHNRLTWINKHRSKPAEWSKEDKVMLDEIIDFFENGTVKLQHDLSLYASWLKSLKDRVQSQWKPSDEQIKVCKEVYADILSSKGFDLGTVNSELNRLEEKLKKLREE